MVNTNTTFLVTGANRGLRHGPIETLLLRPKTTVIAATRSKTPIPTFTNLPTHPGNQLISLTIDSLSSIDAHFAIEFHRVDYSIQELDVVIANSGISKSPTPVLTTPIQEIHVHITIDTIAPLLLFQAAWPLLEKSVAPEFVVISSIAGILGEVEDYVSPCAAYGVSKAAVMNFLVRRVGKENPGLIAFSIHPWVRVFLLFVSDSS